MMPRHCCLALLAALSMALPFASSASSAATSARPNVTPAAIQLSVDAREVQRRLLHVRQTVPEKPGLLVLAYRKFIPGEHGPTGPITDVAALVVSAGGKAIPWRRDPVEMFSFLVDVPALAAEPPLGGLECAGWRLGFGSERPGLQKIREDGDAATYAFASFALDYRDSARYPCLERVDGVPDTLSQILAPRGGGGRP